MKKSKNALYLTIGILSILILCFVCISTIKTLLMITNPYVRSVIAVSYAFTIFYIITGTVFMPSNEAIRFDQKHSILKYSLLSGAIVFAASFIDILCKLKNDNVTESSLYLVSFVSLVFAIITRSKGDINQ